MASASLRFEDRLDGNSNFLSWKVRVTLLLEENDLWDVVKDVVTSPTDPQQVASHKKEVKAMQAIMDAIKDHLIPHISKNKMTKEMFNALVGLYQSVNINKKMILRNKFISIEMTISDSITSYLMKVMQIRDQLAVVGEKVADAKLMNMALNGFLASWEPFVKGICACENLPSFERLWDDCIHEESSDGVKGQQEGW
jgi:hypothetical protein